jgi:hypothetical protein
LGLLIGVGVEEKIVIVSRVRPTWKYFAQKCSKIEKKI